MYLFCKEWAFPQLHCRPKQVWTDNGPQSVNSWGSMSTEQGRTCVPPFAKKAPLFNFKWTNSTHRQTQEYRRRERFELYFPGAVAFRRQPTAQKMACSLIQNHPYIYPARMNGWVTNLSTTGRFQDTSDS